MRASASLGLCPEACLGRDSRLLSALIVGSEATEDVRLSSGREVLVSGYRTDYQPVRAPHTEVRVSSLQLECEGGCWAVVTVEADTNNTECGNNNSGETYCVDQQQINNLGRYIMYHNKTAIYPLTSQELFLLSRSAPRHTRVQLGTQ